jgi:RNA polymerase sigma-70 factor (ECF subfamily)
MLEGAVVATGVSTVEGWGGQVDMAAPNSGRLAFHTGETPLGALVAEAQRGDADAFMALLETHDRMLRSIAFRVLGDRDQMDDALQEVALKAFAALPKFRGQSSFSTWLYRIAYNTCLNRLRGAGRTVSLPDCDEEDRLRLSSGDSAEAVIRRIELAAALGSLTPEQRAVVALVLEEGLDHHTAAEVLDIPMGTVASRLAAARSALRRFLSESLSAGEKR